MASQEEQAYDLFVSYAAADRAWVEGYLLDALAQAGVRCHSEAAFALGVPRLLEFERAVQESQRTLLVLSPATLAEGYGQFTDLLAQSYGLETATWPVIPLLLQPVELPPRLAMLTALDATDPAQWPAVVERLCAELQRQVPGPVPRPPCPYPGMVPFREADSARFFGRDREVQELLERLRLRPFLTVIGPSGSGKSSLVFAGLVPALRASGLFGSGDWLVRALRPGENPLTALTAALEGDPADPAPVVSALLATQPDTSRLLLVVDQFEELFTLARSEVEPFQQALSRLNQTPGCYVVLTVRADFYPDLMTCPLWPQIQAHRAEVLPLDEEGLRQAIVRPAEDAGVFVETALVERLVADAAGEPGVLPLVQETLVLLWERVERRYLPLRAYEALVLPREAYGGPPRTGLQVAMARRADAALVDLDLAQQAVARRIFLRLVQFGEGRADTRRQQPVLALRAASDEPGLFDQTLHHLADRRLLTLSGEEAADRRVDIAHEALIGGWPTLQGWLAERREAEQVRRRLEGKAAEWVRLGRSSGGLLDEVELLEATRWLDSTDAADLGYGEALPALAEASQAAQVEAAAQRRRATWFRLGAVGATAVLVMVVLGVVAVGQGQLAQQQEAAAGTARALAGEAQTAATAEAKARQTAEASEAEAKRQANVATSRELAVSAVSQLLVDPELSVLLAMEAAKAAYTAQAEDALRQSLLASHTRAVLRGHTHEVTSATFSPDGKWVVTTASEDNTARVWEAPTGKLVAELRGHTRSVNSAAFSPDGQWVVTASDDATARVWEASTGKLVAEQHGHLGGGVKSAAFSPDGKWVVTSAKIDYPTVWEASTGKIVAELGAVGSTSAAFSPDGKWVVVEYDDYLHLAQVWEVATWKKVAVLSNLLDVNSASFSPDGRFIITGGGKSAEVREVSTGEVVAEFHGHTDLVNSAAFSPNGEWVVTASRDRTARVWEANTGYTVAELRGHTDAVESAAFSPDGEWVVTASADKTARVWKADTGELVAELRGHTWPVTSATFSLNGKLIVTASRDSTARVWEVASTSKMIAELHGHKVSARTVAFSPDGKFVTTSWDKMVWVWETTTGKVVAELRGHTGPVNSTVFSSDGKWVVTASDDTTARVWEATTGQNVTELHGHTAEVYSAAFSPDGEWVVTASKDGTTRVWETGTDKVNVAELHGYMDSDYFAAAFSPDRKWLAAVNRGASGVRVWDVSTGDIVAELPRNTFSAYSVTFSPNGKWIISLLPPPPSGWRGGVPGQGCVWEAGTGTVVTELRGHTDFVESATFSPDGEWVVTASRDRTARVWEASTGRSAIELSGHTSVVYSAAFSPDGKWVVTASGDRTARVWEASTGKLVTELREHAAVRRAMFNPDSKLVITVIEDGTARIHVCEMCGSAEDLLAVARARVTRELTCPERQTYLHENITCPTPTPAPTP